MEIENNSFGSIEILEIMEDLSLEIREKKIHLMEDGKITQTIEDFDGELIEKDKYKKIAFILVANKLDNTPALILIKPDAIQEKMVFLKLKLDENKLLVPFKKFTFENFFYVPKYDSMEIKMTCIYPRRKQFYTIRILNLETIFEERKIYLDFSRESDDEIDVRKRKYFRYSGSYYGYLPRYSAKFFLEKDIKKISLKKNGICYSEDVELWFDGEGFDGIKALRQIAHCEKRGKIAFYLKFQNGVCFYFFEIFRGALHFRKQFAISKDFFDRMKLNEPDWKSKKLIDSSIGWSSAFCFQGEKFYFCIDKINFKLIRVVKIDSGFWKEEGCFRSKMINEMTDYVERRFIFPNIRFVGQE